VADFIGKKSGTTGYNLVSSFRDEFLFSIFRCNAVILQYKIL